MYFLTARGKPFARQLYADGRVQISAYTRYKETIRISGKAVEAPEDEQVKWRDILYQEQPYLENVYPGESKREIQNLTLYDRIIVYSAEIVSKIVR